MSDRKPLHDAEQVACQICLKQVPRSVAKSPEGTEYVYYFCGAECFDQWRAGPGSKTDPGKK